MASSNGEKKLSREELRQRCADLRLRRAPISGRKVEDMATFLAFGITRTALRAAKAVELVAVPVSRINATVSDQRTAVSSSTTPSTTSTPLPTTPPLPPEPPPHPDHPEGSVPVGDRLPKAYAEWTKLSQQPFRAGVHGPVRLPLERPLPDVPNHVLIPRNAVRRFTGQEKDHIPEEHLTFLTRKNNEEVVMGSIEEVKSWNQVRVLLPVFVVAHPVTGKLRVIYDGRALNVYLADAAGSVKYESLRDALLLRARVATKLDLQAAFRHVRIHEDHQQYFGFTLNGKVYRYTCLPFGCSWSPALYAKMLAPAIEAIRRMGIRIIWYVDDILVVGDTRAELDTALAKVMQTLAAHQWKVAADKTFCHAYTTLPFLGLLTEFEADGTARLSIPSAKRDRIVAELSAILDAGRASINDMQKVVGKLGFARIVVTELGFARSAFDGAIAAAQRQGSYYIPIVGRLQEDLMAILALFRDDSILERKTPLPFSYLAEHVLYSDASAFGWGVLLVDPKAPFVGPPGSVRAAGWSRTGGFSPAEISLSSAAREIRAITYGIVSLDLRDARLLWHSDSTSAVAAISKWASSSAGVADALAELFGEVRRRRLTIDLVHVRRDLELMPVADWLSRRGWRDRQAEWAMPADAVAKVCAALSLQCTGDLFASARNRQFPTFCSRFLEVASRGDAMFTPWWGRSWWAFPPLSMRARILQRLVAYQLIASAESGKRRRRRWINIILLLTPVRVSDPDISLWNSLQPSLVKSVSVFVPSSPHPDVTSASQPSRSSPLLPGLRLLGDEGRPAPRPPPWPLSAYRFRIASSP